ncbi:MAG: hypothetical protein ABW133_16185 [Polyangiaceae bacterium]
MPENRESSELTAGQESFVDPELAALPRPPRQERTISLLLMALTAVLAAFMTAVLASDVRYALRGGEPAPVGDLSHLVPEADLSNRYVRADGTLRLDGAIRYSRPLESDTFQLVPIVGNERLWVELRMPATAPSASAPPVTFVGRMLPVASFAFGLGGLRRSVSAAWGKAVPPDAWVLVDGATPVSSQWTVALAALLLLFAAYNVVMIVRILRPLT